MMTAKYMVPGASNAENDLTAVAGAVWLGNSLTGTPHTRGNIVDTLRIFGVANTDENVAQVEAILARRGTV
jgi:hypothetical protein